MAKLGKVKIMLNGYVRTHTTYPGQIELYAYYDLEDDFFYFEPEEIKKYLPECKLAKRNFSKCGSKENAISVIKAYMGENATEERFLRLGLDIEAVIGKEKEELSQQLQNMCTYSGSRYSNKVVGEKGIWREDKRNLGISIERVKKVTIGNQFVFVSCNEKWENSKDDIGHSGGHHNLISWTPEIESFIVNIQKSMDVMCKQVIDFFNVETQEQLKSNITSVKNHNLLG